MRRWQMTQQGLKGLFLVVLILASCSAPSDNGAGGGCGGSEASVNCLNVTRITPTSTISGDTSNVDALRDQCRDLTGTVISIEPFGDHNALVTLANTQFPTATAPTSRPLDIGTIGYSLTYTLNQCPAAARGCPPLTGFTSGESIVIPAGQTVTVTLPFVPLSVEKPIRSGWGRARDCCPVLYVPRTPSRPKRLA